MNHPTPELLGRINSRSGRTLDMYRGYTPDMVDQLIRKSRQTEIVKRCHKDSEVRFVSRETFAGWVVKGKGGREVYPLLNADDGDLAGTIWLGAEGFPTERYKHVPVGKLAVASAMSDTYAIRLYEGYDSDGVAKPFTRMALEDHARRRLVGDQGARPLFTGVHLETDSDNLRARATYEHLMGQNNGFEVIGEAGKRIAMAMTAQRIAEAFDLAA